MARSAGFVYMIYDHKANVCKVGRITQRFIDVIGAHNHDVDVDNYIDAEIERVHNVNARIRNG